MKLQHVLLAGLVAATAVSCELSGKSEATPQLFIGAINLTGNDTLGFYAGRLDSVHIGDTIWFQTQVFSQYNPLLEYRVESSDTACVEFIWGDPQRLDSIFTEYGDGRFRLDGTANILSFPFKYIIKKPKDKLSLTFSALSDASADYCSRSITIMTPTKKRKADSTPQEPNAPTNK